MVPDSPTTTSFVPLSLTDILSKPQRTLRSIHTTTTTNHVRPGISAQHGSSGSIKTIVGGGGGNSGGSGGESGGLASLPRRTSHAPTLSLPSTSSLPTSTTTPTTLGNQDRLRQAMLKKQEDAMCERLGFNQRDPSILNLHGDSTNSSTSSLNLTTPIAKTLIGGQQTNNLNESDGEELKVLRSQVLRLNEENKRLKGEMIELKNELIKVNQQSSRVQINNGQDGLGASQLKELEKSFAEQETLLAGYQKDAEKSFMTIEAMKKQARRYTDIIAKTFGPNYETELGLDKEIGSIATTRILTSTTGISSPVVRNQQQHLRATNRLSFGGVQQPYSSSSSTTTACATPTMTRMGGFEGDIVEEDETSMESKGVDTESIEREQQKEGDKQQEMMREYVDGVQTLLRSLEQRLIKRDYELELMENRAKEEKRLAEIKVVEIGKMVDALNA